MTENEFFFLQNSKWSKIKMKHDERYNRFSKPEKWFIDKRIYIYIFHLVTAFFASYRVC